MRYFRPLFSLCVLLLVSLACGSVDATATPTVYRTQETLPTADRTQNATATPTATQTGIPTPTPIIPPGVTATPSLLVPPPANVLDEYSGGFRYWPNEGGDRFEAWFLPDAQCTVTVSALRIRGGLGTQHPTVGYLSAGDVYPDDGLGLMVMEVLNGVPFSEQWLCTYDTNTCIAYRYNSQQYCVISTTD